MKLDFCPSNFGLWGKGKGPRGFPKMFSMIIYTFDGKMQTPVMIKKSYWPPSKTVQKYLKMDQRGLWGCEIKKMLFSSEFLLIIFTRKSKISKKYNIPLLGFNNGCEKKKLIRVIMGYMRVILRFNVWKKSFNIFFIL